MIVAGVLFIVSGVIGLASHRDSNPEPEEEPPTKTQVPPDRPEERDRRAISPHEAQKALTDP